MPKLNVTVFHAIGTFSGFLEFEDDCTQADMIEAEKGFQKEINNINRLTIAQLDGTSLTFTEGFLKNCVIATKVEGV